MDWINGLFGAKNAVQAAQNWQQQQQPPQQQMQPQQAQQQQQMAPPPQAAPPPQEPQRDFGPLRPDQQEEFWYHHFEIEGAYNDPPKKAQLLQKFGYRDEAHFKRVSETFQSSADSQTMTQAMMAARMRQQQEKQQAQLAANPEMMAPIEGITCETYAQMSAQQAKGLSQDQFVALLAQNGMDQAKFARVSKGWIDRMSKDTTATVATVYGKAFSSAGQGQFGAGGAAGGQAIGSFNAQGALTGPGGAEPCTFEKYCEIMGAQSAWAKSGMDVNAMLKQKFNMNALDWSNLGSYWSTKMMSDISYAQRVGDMTQHYEKQYAQPSADADLKF
ncbi:MAG: hypothetical protein ACRELY_30035 [Polyangiaceae bacterium]